MDDTCCRDFFLHPTQARHRHFEVLRAYFVDHHSLPEIAHTSGYTYGTVRNFVAQFRAQCRAGQVPPFLSSHRVAAPATMSSTITSPHRNPQPSPIAASSPSSLAGTSVPDWRASSFSCPCLSACTSIHWFDKPVTPDREWSRHPPPC